MSLLFYSTNLVDQAEFTPSTENALFPAENLKDYRRTKVFRSTTNTDSIILDLQETSEIDSIFLVDSPRDGFGITTVSIDFSATSNFTSPAHTESVTFSTVHGMGFTSFSLQNYRFVRINLASSLGYCELSKIFIGKAIDMNRCFSFGWSFKDDEIVSTKQNRYGQKFSDIVSRQKEISFSVKMLSKDQLDQFFELYDLKGKSKPFFMSMECAEVINNKERFSGMFFFKEVPTITNTSFNRYSISISLEEAL